MTSFNNVKNKTKEDAKKVEDRIVKDAKAVKADAKKAGHKLAEDTQKLTKKVKDKI